MKHLIEYSKYRKYPAINYSLLSAVDKSPRSLQNEKKESTAMNNGSLVDVLLTNPDAFEDEFYIMQENKLTASTLTLFNELINRAPKFSKKKVEKELYKIIVDLKLWSSITKPNLIDEKVRNKELWSNIEDHYKSGGKSKIYKKDFEAANELVSSLKNHSFTHKYFNSSETTEIMYQVPIVFEYEGVKYKILLDGLLIDSWSKTITPFDLKTSEESAYAFPSKILRWRYDIQAALYSRGAKVFFEANFPNFTMKDFTFVVGSFNSPSNPLVYNAKGILEQGEYGGTVHDRPVRGFKQLTENYLWHLDTNQWEYPKEIYENNGVINL